jgi:hypothetical protein
MAASFASLWLVVLLGLAGAPSPSSPEASRARFDTIAAHLDTGGDLLVVANVDGIVEGAVDLVRGCAEMASPRAGAANPGLAALDRLPAYVKSSGFYAVDGVGLSVVPRADDLHDLKAFVCRDPAAAALPLWRAAVGGAPHNLRAPGCVPADTALLRVFTGEPQQLWKLVTDAVRQVGGPEAWQAFGRALADGATPALGTNIEAVVASLADEGFLAITLSTNQTMDVPVPNRGGDADEPALTIPLPALLVGAAVRDGTLGAALQHWLAFRKLPVVRSEAGKAVLYTVNVPAPLPLPLAPTFTTYKGLFLFGTSADAVKAAVAAADGAAALAAAPAFRKAFAGLPMANNGLLYVDPRLGETVAKVQARLLSQAAPDRKAEALQRLFGRGVATAAALVIVNEKDGVALRGTTSSGGREALVSLSVVPLAMTAAIAIPSFAKSRQQAQRAACIANLRQMDQAKALWSTENNRPDGDAVTAADLKTMLPNGRLPVCPQGGRYTLGAVGAKPACSLPGHALP